jgi:hypothetical protein
MYSDDDLESAVEAGILTASSVAAFRAHAERRANGTAADEEQFRLLTGFNDIFVVIGCALVLAAVAMIAAAYLPRFGGLAVAAAAWGLAEFFTRKRRMALPSIALLLACVGGVFTSGSLLFDQSGAGMALGGVAAAAAAWAHWRRFRVPITVAAGAAAVVGGLLGWLILVLPMARDWVAAAMLAAGLAVFALAMRWDATDRLRRTRRSDVAFWLHILAAPLMVRGAFGIFGIAEAHADAAQAIAVVLLYAGIAVVSLAIDRRALMVSALGYVLFTFSGFLGQFGMISLNFAIAALFIGSALLLLSAFWHGSRAFVLRRIPRSLQARLAPG